MAQRKQLLRQISGLTKRLALSALILGLALQRPLFMEPTSAQGQSSGQTPVSVGIFRDQLPQSFRVTDKKSGKTLVFESRGNGYHFYTAENPRRSKFVPFAKIDQVLVTMLEDRAIRENVGTDVRMSRLVSTLVRVSLSEGNVVNRLLTGIVRNDGTTFSGSLLAADGKTLADLEVNLSEEGRISQALRPTQLGGGLPESPPSDSLSLRDRGFQLRDAKFLMSNSLRHSSTPVTLGARPPAFEVVTITVGIVAVAAGACIINMLLTDCGFECTETCGQGKVASFSEGWCGASCTCTCK